MSNVFALAGRPTALRRMGMDIEIVTPLNHETLTRRMP